MTNRLFDSPVAWNAALVRIGVVVVTSAVAAADVAMFALRLVNPVWIRSVVESTSPFTPPIFVGIWTLQVVLALTPDQTLAAIGGHLFGTIADTVYSMVSVVAGSATIFPLVRHFGRPTVERLIIDDALTRFGDFADRRGITGLFVLFLLLAFPDGTLCAFAGLLPFRLRTLAVLVIVGRLSTFAPAAAVGRNAGAASYETVAFLVRIGVVISAIVYRCCDELAAEVG